MAVPPVVNSFWQHLAESGLLEGREVTALSRELAVQGVKSDEDAARSLIERGVITQFQSEWLLEGRSRGLIFDEFKLLDLLGVGGMGWVYQAENTKTKEIVALKVLLEQFKHDRGMLARFQQEARAGLRLNHPNVVRTHRLGSAGGSHYVIMDLVEGPSLLEVLLRKKRLKWGQACDFARQALLGLHHAHEAGLVHRDVKPQNLLIERDGTVKLLDFGLAMIREGETGEEFSMAMIFGHECVGTAAYMSPEQAEDSLAVDGRSDIYGLGCTLFAALTGDTPFAERSVTDVQKAHRAKAPRNVRDLAPSVPEGVAKVVMQMLAKNREDRYATAGEAAAALVEWSKPAPIEFDFDKILNERKKQAREKLAEYLKSRAKLSGVGGSTARPSAISSVVKLAPGIKVRFDDKGHPLPSTGSHDAGPHSVSSIQLEQMSRAGTHSHREATTLEASGAVLVPISGDRFRPLTQNRVTIGRNDNCTIQLNDQSISGRHCEIHFDGTRWWITDLGSRNGTRVNGVPIKQRPLKPGDEITIGSHLTYRLDCADSAPNRAGLLTKRRLQIVFTIAAVLATIFLVWWLTQGR
ncbi:MAG: FHA domain-containing serine/threonine-protein kinase [Planctomycetales bacterium]|nr:FHA domain-containing serine/threonine-protein kinase [Planctomycetales bacterium]